MLSLAVAAVAQAPTPLTADQLLLLYNANSPDSRQLAEHYAKVRGVPADRLLGLSLEAGEQTSHTRYESEIAEVALHWLQAHDPQGAVRCLLTFYGVPFRIGVFRPRQEDLQVLPDIEQELAHASAALAELTARLEALAAGTTQPASRPSAPAPSVDWLLREYGRARQQARERLGRAAEDEQHVREQQAFLAIMRRAEGIESILNGVQASAEQLSDEQQRQLEQERAAVRAAKGRAMRLLGAGPGTSQYEEGLAHLAEIEGLVGVVGYLSAWQQTLAGSKETIAAVDSELALLWHGRYPLHRWLPNPLYMHRFAERTDPAEAPTLFVSRLDGPSPEVVRRMIDDAVQAEKIGLAGRMYLDARGLHGNDEYARYDASLVALARRVAATGRLPVVLDEYGSVFAPNSCPQAALYCGWYSHRRYVPAFQFVPGAVGFHIASSEAISLRTDKGYWCPHLLADGCAATLGPVHEPYLQAFPNPEEFFALLLCGRFTLAECYAYTLPGHSWMMMLLGDPLYRPFAKDPVLDADAVIAELARVPIPASSEDDR